MQVPIGAGYTDFWMSLALMTTNKGSISSTKWNNSCSACNMWASVEEIEPTRRTTNAAFQECYIHALDKLAGSKTHIQCNVVCTSNRIMGIVNSDSVPRMNIDDIIRLMEADPRCAGLLKRSSALWRLVDDQPATPFNAFNRVFDLGFSITCAWENFFRTKIVTRIMRSFVRAGLTKMLPEDRPRRLEVASLINIEAPLKPQELFISKTSAFCRNSWLAWTRPTDEEKHEAKAAKDQARKELEEKRAAKKMGNASARAAKRKSDDQVVEDDDATDDDDESSADNDENAINFIPVMKKVDGEVQLVSKDVRKMSIEGAVIVDDVQL